MKKKGLLIFSTVSLLLLSGINFRAFAQTVTTYIYAKSAVGSFITGNSTAATRTDNNIVSDNGTQRGYAVFDLSSIPAGAVIDSINIGFNTAAYMGIGAPSDWQTFGYPGSLVSVTSAATLFADMISGSLLTTQTYGTATGNQLLSSTAAATAFIQSNIGDSVSICFTSAGTRKYTITGEAGTTATTGAHAPYLAITYCQPTSAGVITGPSEICPGYTITLSDDTTGGSWIESNTNAIIIDEFGDIYGNTPGYDTIAYIVTNGCGITDTSATVVNVINPPTLSITASADTICNGGSSRLIAGTAMDSILQQNFNTSTAPWTSDTTGSVSTLPAGAWNVYPDGYTYASSFGVDFTFHSPDNTPFALVNADISDSGSVTVAQLISPAFSLAGLDSATLTFQQYYENYLDTSAEVDISTDGGATWITLANYADSVGSNDSIGSAIAFVSESISLTPYVGYSNVMIRFYYNSPWGYWWALDNVSVNGGAAATWTSAYSDLYNDAGFTSPYIGANTDTVYALPITVPSTTTFTYYAYESTSGCSSNDSVTVTVLVPASPIQGNNIICTGTTATLTDSTLGGTWSATNATASIDPVLGIDSGITAGTDTVLYTVSTICGSVIDTFVLTVNPSPNAGTITGVAYLCTSTTVTFVDTAAGGAGFWESMDPAIASVDAAGDVTGLTIGIDSIYYFVNNSCGFVYASYGVSVATVFIPSVSIEANPGDTSCFGIAVTYSAIAVNSGSSPTFVWSINGATAATSDTFSYFPNNGDVVSCVVTSDAPCLSGASTASASVTMVVNNATAPAITINDGIYGDSVCIFTSVPYSATITNGGTSPTYLWSVNGIPAASGSSFIYAPNNGDSITCQVTSSNVCAIPDTATSNSIVMSVFTSEDPIVNITSNPGDTLCAGSPVTFTASSIFGGFAPFYRWSKNGINVATGPDYSFTPGNGDSVYCMLESSSACSIYDSVFSDTAVLTTVSPVTPEVEITSLGGTLISVRALDTLVAVISNPTFPVTYQWEIDGAPIPGATSAIFVAADTTAVTASITCIVTNGDPCHTSGASNTLVITVQNAGVKQITLTGSDIILLPNPNNGTFLVQGTLPAGNNEVTLEVSDIVGHIVYQDVVSVQNGMIKSPVNLDNNTANGMYLVHINGENINEVIRFTLSR